ncbi:hypothetical protein ACHAXR_001717 [Thalassiosira sp. AJA248-18]
MPPRRVLIRGVSVLLLFEEILLFSLRVWSAYQ